MNIIAKFQKNQTLVVFYFSIQPEDLNDIDLLCINSNNEITIQTILYISI